MVKKINWDDLSERFNTLSVVYNLSENILYEKIQSFIQEKHYFELLYSFVKGYRYYGLNLKSKPFKDFDKRRFLNMLRKREKMNVSQKIVFYYFFKEEFF